MIELGGNIRFHGFEALDQADVLIAKKLVGSYVRRMCDEVEGCTSTELFLERSEKGFSIKTVTTVKAEKYEADAQGTNVFMTIDASLKKLLKELQVEL